MNMKLNKTVLTIGLVVEALFTIWGGAIYLKTSSIGFLFFTLLSLGGTAFFGYRLYKKLKEVIVVEEPDVKPTTEFPAMPTTELPYVPPVTEDPATEQHGGKTTKPKRKYTRRKPKKPRAKK